MTRIEPLAALVGIDRYGIALTVETPDLRRALHTPARTLLAMTAPPPIEPPIRPPFGPPGGYVEPSDEYLERELAQLRSNIVRFGFTKIVVGTGECSVPGCPCSPDPFPFTYSIGMCEHRLPEFVSFGLGLSMASEVVDPICRAMVDGGQLPIGRDQLLALPNGRTAALVPVPDLWVDHDPGRISRWLAVYETMPIPSFVQICWSDADGNMPWEPECDPYVAAVQPLLELDPINFPEPVDPAIFGWNDG